MNRLHNTNNKFIRLNKEYEQNLPNGKPRGLYYGIDDSWLSWVIPNMPDNVGKNVFKLYIDDNSLYRIQNLKELETFLKRYEKKVGAFDCIDWGDVAKEYSGIEIINYEYIKWRHMCFKHIWFLGWDCDSGCIWDLSIIKKVKQIKS